LELPNDSSSLKGSVYFAISGKKWQNSPRRAFAIGGKMTLPHLNVNVAVKSPNVESFCWNNGQFAALWMRPHPRVVRLVQ